MYGGDPDNQNSDHEWYHCVDQRSGEEFFCTRWMYIETVPIGCLQDIFNVSYSMEDFWRLFFKHPWTAMVWFCLEADTPADEGTDTTEDDTYYY